MSGKILALGCLVTFSAFATLAQGNLTPLAAPAPSMKSLDQIEPRVPISALPYTISTPGSYYITTNLLVAVNNGIVIAANNVNLDLNGFTISSIQSPASTGKGIALGSGSGPVTNITIRNGFITGSVTNNGGTYSGNGFGYGIFQFGGQPAVNVHVSDVAVSGCQFVGIHLGGSNSVVESCSVNMVGSYGIYAQSISDSSAMNCGNFGIYATASANNCSGSSSGGNGLSAASAENCYGSSTIGNGISAINALNCYGTSGSGTGLSATIVENCYGTSSSGTGVAGTTVANSYGTSGGGGSGISANNAQNSYGTSSANGTGLSASIAQNCYGGSSIGTGISGNVVQSSYGLSNGQSGYGIYTASAHNCYGYNSGSGIGIYATSVALGCVGFSNNGTGLYAYIANSCNGLSGTGTGLNFTHNVNSF